MPSHAIDLPMDEVLHRYENGEIGRDLAKDYDCSEATIMKRIAHAKSARVLTPPVVLDGETGYFCDAAGNRLTRAELLSYVKSERSRERVKRVDKIEQEHTLHLAS